MATRTRKPDWSRVLARLRHRAAAGGVAIRFAYFDAQLRVVIPPQPVRSATRMTLVKAYAATKRRHLNKHLRGHARCPQHPLTTSLRPPR